MLTVIDYCRSIRKSRTRFLCKCDCGKHTEVDGPLLNSGRIKSCGCYKKTMIEVLFPFREENLLVKQ